MTLKEYIARTIMAYHENNLPTPTTMHFDIAIMPKSGWNEGKIEHTIIVDESPSQNSSRIKFDVLVN